MDSELAFIVGFLIFTADLGAITWLVSLGLEVAAGGGWSRGKSLMFLAILTLKVGLVLLALAGSLLWFEVKPFPLFLGSLSALLLFSFYLLTKNLKRTPQS